MQFFTLLVAVLALPFTVSALPSHADADLEALATDWKTELGWDGTVVEGSVINLEKRDDSEQLEKRAGGVYYCQAFGFGGPCAYQTLSSSNVCISLSGSAFRYTISSIGPDPGVTCYLYWSEWCSGTASASIYNPGGNLAGAYGGNPNYWGQWNDNVGAIKCTS